MFFAGFQAAYVFDFECIFWVVRMNESYISGCTDFPRPILSRSSSENHSGSEGRRSSRSEVP